MSLFSFFLLCIGLQAFFIIILCKDSKDNCKKITLDYLISGILYNLIIITISWYCLKISLPELLKLIRNINL